jgi:2-amino-4-hydroxy-6-hydroxymethyldihydropteridine diphosphokinase
MILIGLGANLPGPDGSPPIETCRQAVLAMDAIPGIRLRGLSRWYQTAPVPVSSQPPYVNAIARLEAAPGATEPDPRELLATLQALEAQAGRVRGDRNAPRVLDLDIIAMGEGGRTVRAAPDPVLPHPRAHQRAFVLVPLRDVAPDWMHPVLGRSLTDLIAALPPQEIWVL